MASTGCTCHREFRGTTIGSGSVEPLESRPSGTAAADWPGEIHLQHKPLLGGPNSSKHRPSQTGVLMSPGLSPVEFSSSSPKIHVWALISPCCPCFPFILQPSNHPHPPPLHTSRCRLHSFSCTAIHSFFVDSGFPLFRSPSTTPLLSTRPRPTVSDVFTRVPVSILLISRMISVTLFRI